MKNKQKWLFLASLLVNIDSTLGPLSAHCKTNVKNLDVYFHGSFKLCRQLSAVVTSQVALPISDS